MSVLVLHSERISYVLEINGNATAGELPSVDPQLKGWKIKEDDDGMKIVPEWDTEENKKKMTVMRQAILKRCGCKKSNCVKKSCSCFKNQSKCSNVITVKTG